MTQFYTDPSREQEQHALPNAEAFYVVDEVKGVYNGDDVIFAGSGWYWWACMPGCLPDGDPIGPFNTEQLAIDDGQEAE